MAWTPFALRDSALGQAYGGSRWFLGLLVVFAAFLLLALIHAQERSEKLTVELTVRSMQIGMKVAMAEAMARGREAELKHWPGTNPVRWLGGPPQGYRGECSGQDIAEMPGGSWCFEIGAGELVYRPRFDHHLRLIGGEGAAGRILRWRVTGPAGLSQNPPFLAGNLKLMTPYVWFGD